jgi:hypothetical protein
LSPLLVWCCFSFNSIPLIPIVAMACGSKRVNPVFFTRLLVVVLNPCMLVPCRPWCLLGSCSDNRTAKNPGDVSVHLVHLGRGIYKLFGHLCSVVCVASFDAPSLAMACVLEEVDHLSSLLPCSILSWFLSSYNGVRIKRERDFSCL